MARKTIMGKTVSQKDKKEAQSAAELMGNEFIELDDLVYAPLHALADSNLRLHSHIVETVKNMGTLKRDGKEEIIQLENMKIAYDQIHSDGEDGYSVDNMQLEVPLLSIIPVTNMTVDKAEISFSAEIRAVSNKDGVNKINARISSPDQRDSDFLPRVSYKMSVSSLPATEGFLRISDLMNANQLAKKTDTTPVTLNGALSDDEQKDKWKKLLILKTNIKRLQQLYQKISDILAEQQKVREIGGNNSESELFIIDKERYQTIQTKITNKIMELQDQILSLEVQDEMDSLEGLKDEDSNEK
ncbi:MAG: DUF2589 domain-containing protein [Treponema sp.]|nr:DUF2589 domain-containing protein [Treponema sp.]